MSKSLLLLTTIFLITLLLQNSRITGKQTRRRPRIVLAHFQVKVTLSDYRNRGDRGANGNRCDGRRYLAWSDCDPYFSVRLFLHGSQPERKSRVYENTREINRAFFSPIFNVRKNVVAWGRSTYVNMKLEIIDRDTSSGHDDIASKLIRFKFQKNLQKTINVKWKHVSLKVKIIIICLPYYRGDYCEQKRIRQQKSKLTTKPTTTTTTTRKTTTTTPIPTTKTATTTTTTTVVPSTITIVSTRTRLATSTRVSTATNQQIYFERPKKALKEKNDQPREGSTNIYLIITATLGFFLIITIIIIFLMMRRKCNATEKPSHPDMSVRITQLMADDDIDFINRNKHNDMSNKLYYSSLARSQLPSIPTETDTAGNYLLPGPETGVDTYTTLDHDPNYEALPDIDFGTDVYAVPQGDDETDNNGNDDCYAEIN